MHLFPIEMHIDAAIVCKDFAEEDKAAAEKLDELGAEDFVTVGLLLVLHEVLSRSKWWIDIDELDLPAGAEMIRPLLVSQQFA